MVVRLDRNEINGLRSLIRVGLEYGDHDNDGKMDILAPQSNGEFQRKLKKIAREFDDLNNQDAALPLDKRNGVTVVMAVRDWKYGLFKPLIRS